MHLLHYLTPCVFLFFVQFSCFTQAKTFPFFKTSNVVQDMRLGQMDLNRHKDFLSDTRLRVDRKLSEDTEDKETDKSHRFSLTTSDSNIVCEDLFIDENLCPFDSNLQVDFYSIERNETSYGHLCSTYSDPENDCVITLAKNRVYGVIRTKKSKDFKEFRVSECEDDSGRNCVSFVSDGDFEGHCGLLELPPVTRGTFDHESNHLSHKYEKEILSSRSLSERLELWENCFPNNDVLHTFSIGISIGSSLFGSSLLNSDLESALSLVEATVAEANVVLVQQMNLKLVVKHIEIVHSSLAGLFPWDNKDCSGSIYDQLSKYTRHSSASPQGLWHLFDSCYSSTSPAVGLAYKGAVCKGNYNKAVTYMFHKSSFWLTFAHEIGHNLGASHSFEEGQGTTGGIMDYGDKLLDGEFQFNRRYRETEICTELRESKDECPEFWKIAGSQGVCGNGIVEAGEDCECSLGESECKCCLNCKLRDSAQCDRLYNPCCDRECKWKDSSSACDASGGLGYCRNGYCISPRCEMYGLDSFCGTSETNPCLIKCGAQDGVCYSMEGWLMDGKPINHVRDGAFCRAESVEEGLCDNGMCIEAEGILPDESVAGEEQELSETCCEDLVNTGSGNFVFRSPVFTDVCGDANWNQQGCTRGNYAYAKNTCESHGLRLCSYEEVEAGVLQGSGCNVNTKRLWTSSECESGHFAAMAVQGQGKLCRSDDLNFKVACCADRCE